MAVAILLGVTVTLLFDAQAVKTQAARIMMEKKQRLLRMDGDVALSFWPGLGLRVTKVSLSEKGNETVFASAEKARLSLQLLPLLKKELAVGTVELDGIHLRLVRHKDGSFNFDDLISQEKEKSPLRFDVAAVRLSNGNLEYLDEAVPRTLKVAALDLVTERLANAAEGKLSLGGKLAVDKPALAGDLKLVGHYRYDLDKKEYALDGLDIRSSGDYAGLKGGVLSLSSAVVSLKGSAVEAIKLELGAKGKAGEEAVQATLSVPKLSMNGATSASEAVTFNASTESPAGKSSLKADLAGFNLAGNRLSASKLSLAAQRSQGEAAYRLSLASSVTGDLGTQNFKLAQLGGELELNQPGLAVKPLVLALSGALEADLARPMVSLSLNAAHDTTHLAAKVSVPRFSPLALEFALDLDKLDADKYLLPASKPAATAAPAQPKPLDFSFLNSLDMTGSIKIGSLQFQGIKAANLRLDMKARNGRLDVAPMAASLYQGTLNGSLSVNAKDNKLAVKQALSGVAINPLLKDVAKKDILEGRGNISLDVSSAGPDLPALVKGLGGSARMELKDGAVKGINLAKSLRDLKGKLIQRQDSTQAANASEKTDFTELTASFDIAQGVARNKDLSAKSPFLRLTGEGLFDLPKETMDYTAKVSVVASTAGQAGKDLADLKGLTIPVRLTGPFQSPSYKLAFADVVSEVVTGQVKAKVEDTKQQVRDQAKAKAADALKGLLGR